MEALKSHWASSSCPHFDPPRNFKAAGKILWAETFYQGPFGPAAPSGMTSAQKIGLAYERKAHLYLSSLYPRNYGGALWIKFQSMSSPHWRWAQPDGLCMDLVNSQLTIIEIKNTHDVRAWWSLRQLYEPLVSHIFGASWRVAVCEVCRWFDPATPWPEAYRLVKGPMDLKAGEFGIHITSAR